MTYKERLELYTRILEVTLDKAPNRFVALVEEYLTKEDIKNLFYILDYSPEGYVY